MWCFILLQENALKILRFKCLDIWAQNRKLNSSQETYATFSNILLISCEICDWKSRQNWNHVFHNLWKTEAAWENEIAQFKNIDYCCLATYTFHLLFRQRMNALIRNFQKSCFQRSNCWEASFVCILRKACFFEWFLTLALILKFPKSCFPIIKWSKSFICLWFFVKFAFFERFLQLTLEAKIVVSATIFFWKMPSNMIQTKCRKLSNCYRWFL